jgi:hypothetical protein
LVRLPSDLRVHKPVVQGAHAQRLNDLRAFDSILAGATSCADLLVDTQAVPVDPGMDSNHELDNILKPHNLLILQSR